MANRRSAKSGTELSGRTDGFGGVQAQFLCAALVEIKHQGQRSAACSPSGSVNVMAKKAEIEFNGVLGEITRQLDVHPSTRPDRAAGGRVRSMRLPIDRKVGQKQCDSSGSHHCPCSHSRRSSAPRGRSQSATPASAALPAGGTRYAKVRHVCAAPTPRRASCLALALVPSRPGAAGASLAQAGAGCGVGGACRGPHSGRPRRRIRVLARDRRRRPDARDRRRVRRPERSKKTSPRSTRSTACPRAPPATVACEKVGQTGSASELPPADTRGWSVEITLDVESAHSVCPNCRILLVEAELGNVRGPRRGGERGGRAGRRRDVQLLRRLRGRLRRERNRRLRPPGHRVTAASGDSGYLNWDFVFEAGAAPGLPDVPAALPTVVSVGGTSLKLKASGARKSETVWNGTGRPDARRTEADRRQRGRLQHAVQQRPPGSRRRPGSARRGAGPRASTTTSPPTATRSRASTSTTPTSTNRASPAAGSR